ncbi:MAG TPA: nucleotidyltransferase family protein [bacterium]|nr:nucleotidyltransferase family protein [bacterium]
MGEDAANALRFIGLCLAPLDQARRPMLADAAAKVTDWERALLLSGAKHVTPTVYACLRDSGLLSAVPAPVAARFEKLYVMNASVSALRLHQARKVTSILRERGCRMLYFKGASLVMARDYPDAGRRMFSDVDVLAHGSSRDMVRAAFKEAGGFTEQPSQVMEDWEVTSWIDEFSNELEVHWGLKPHNGAAAGLAEQRLMANAYELEYRGRRVLVPSPEDRFIQAALHFTAHHYFDSSYFMTGISDLSHVLAAHGLKFDWDRIVEGARAERMLEHLAVAAGLAYELTRHEPLHYALAAMEERAPGLRDTAAPLVASLSRLALKPWTFYSFYERRLFVKKSWGEWARYVFAAMKRRIVHPKQAPATPKHPGRDYEGITGEPRHERRLGDADFLRYLLALYRFDRRIAYQIKIGGEGREDGG